MRTTTTTSLNDSSGYADVMDALDDERLLNELCLHLVPGVGPRIYQSLLDRFADCNEVLSASVAALQEVPGVGQRLAGAIAQAKQTIDAERELTRCRELGINLYLRSSESYPRMLREICDAPSVLYCKGSLKPEDEIALAIVGSRRCTVYGRRQAERLAGALSRAGITIVSGLARGIDAAAHRAALAAGGRTIAVTATGLESVYPPEHGELFDQIVGQGAALTESHLDQKPVSGIFPQRNRLISGLSLAIIVVEASRNSGALHTARHAMEQGRDVLVVPGCVDSLASEGCHDLIRDGCTLIRNVDDVLESLGPLAHPVVTEQQREVHSLREFSLNQREREVLDLISSEPKHIDLVLRDCDIDSSRVLATLTILEMKRFIRRLPGGNLVRATN